MADPEVEAYEEGGEEGGKKKRKVFPQLYTFLLGMAGVGVAIVLAKLLDQFGHFKRWVAVSELYQFEWTGKKTQIAYFLCVYIVKIFAWEACFPTYLGAFFGNAILMVITYGLVVACGSFMLFVSVFRILHNTKQLFLVLLVTTTIFLATIFVPIMVPRKIDGEGVRQILRGANMFYFVAYSLVMYNQWSKLNVMAASLPISESRVYRAGSDLYIVVTLVQFLEYMRVYWIKKVGYPIHKLFCDITLFYTATLWCLILCVMYYSGCDSCKVYIPPPTGAIEGPLVEKNADTICWWTKATSFKGPDIDTLLYTKTPRNDSYKLLDILDFYWPVPTINKLIPGPFPDFYSFRQPTFFRDIEGKFFNFLTTTKVTFWADSLGLTYSDVEYVDDFRRMVGIGWSSCYSQDYFDEHQIRCVGVFIRVFTHILTTKGCFETRWQGLIEKPRIAEIVITYGVVPKRHKFPVFKDTLHYIDNLCIIKVPYGKIPAPPIPSYLDWFWLPDLKYDGWNQENHLPTAQNYENFIYGAPYHKRRIWSHIKNHEAWFELPSRRLDYNSCFHESETKFKQRWPEGHAMLCYNENDKWDGKYDIPQGSIIALRWQDKIFKRGLFGIPIYGYVDVVQYHYYIVGITVEPLTARSLRGHQLYFIAFGDYSEAIREYVYGTTKLEDCVDTPFIPI